MNKAFTISSRVIREGKEATFIDSFLKSNNLFEKEDLNYMILQETMTDGGIPDIIVVSWEKKLKLKWSPERKNLDKDDIKILHFITSKRSKGISVNLLINKLGFSPNKIKKTIPKLIRSNLIEFFEKKIYVKEIDNNFFVRDIISIEAKLTNWKKAIEQAQLNLNFSSKSYILIPAKKNQKMDSFQNEKITGLITYDGEKAKVLRKAKKNKLPGSYFSWIINEHIGNLVYGK